MGYNGDMNMIQTGAERKGIQGEPESPRPPPLCGRSASLAESSVFDKYQGYRNRSWKGGHGNRGFLDSGITRQGTHQCLQGIGEDPSGPVAALPVIQTDVIVGPLLANGSADEVEAGYSPARPE